GLELVQDLRQLGDLVLAEIQLEGEEPERPAHAEGAASAAELAAAAEPELEPVPFRTFAARTRTARSVPAGAGLPQPPHHAWVHRFSSSPGQLRLPAGSSGVGEMPHASWE